jgi:glycerol-3-phosphate O-acyltransferase/dihydroxyacetone phosphate acyltransferase
MVLTIRLIPSLLINLMLNVFYRSIVVENAELIPKNGRPCIVCANHGNSLVDAGILVKVIPSNIRNMIRLTAKSTLFGHGTFTSWLVASTGAVPIQRRKDFADGRTDNSHVMEGLLSTLELGDAICLFPEGVSRYHPAIAPFKTGVARILSDVLTRNRHNPVFEVLVLPVSITYMHREYFRSDVLITFNSPMSFRVKDHSDFLAPADKVQAVTTQMYQARILLMRHRGTWLHLLSSHHSSMRH